jgi:hypothetical protein
MSSFKSTQKPFMVKVHFFQANNDVEISTSWHDYQYACGFRAPEQIVKDVFKQPNMPNLSRLWTTKKGACNIKAPFVRPFITCATNRRDVEPTCRVFIPEKNQRMIVLEADDPYPDTVIN